MGHSHRHPRREIKAAPRISRSHCKAPAIPSLSSTPFVAQPPIAEVTLAASRLPIIPAKMRIAAMRFPQSDFQRKSDQRRVQSVGLEKIFMAHGGQIIVKIFCCVRQSSNVTVLKDDFCSHDSSVLYIDGDVVDVRDVKKID